MNVAAERGHIEIIEMFKMWGVGNNFDEAMDHAAGYGHTEIVKLFKEWGAKQICPSCVSCS